MRVKEATILLVILLLASILSIWTQNIAAQQPLGMVSYWKFEEDNGTTAYDSVGSNDGTLVNSPTWTTGIIDGALSFDGVDDFIEVPYSSTLDIGTYSGNR